MAMTKEERATQIDLANRLGEQGYATYAKLFMLFELRLTSDPRAIGYMEPGKGRITLNRTIKPHQMLLTIRHEILHEYLSHELRLLEHLDKKFPELNSDEASLKDILYRDQNFNIAADYEISNRGYTEQDKKDMRAIEFNGQIVSGLVTEDQHPDWVDLTVEEMYDLLQDEREQAQDEANSDQEGQDQSDEQEYKDGENPEGGDGQGEDGSDGEGESEGGEGQSGDSDGEDGEDESKNGESGNDQKGNDSSSGQDSNSQNGNQQGGQSSGGQSNLRIIRGTMRNGKFYDVNGNEIKPGG